MTGRETAPAPAAAWAGPAPPGVARRLQAVSAAVSVGLLAALALLGLVALGPASATALLPASVVLGSAVAVLDDVARPERPVDLGAVVAAGGSCWLLLLAAAGLASLGGAGDEAALTVGLAVTAWWAARRAAVGATSRGQGVAALLAALPTDLLLEEWHRLGLEVEAGSGPGSSRDLARLRAAVLAELLARRPGARSARADEPRSAGAARDAPPPVPAPEPRDGGDDLQRRHPRGGTDSEGTV